MTMTFPVCNWYYGTFQQDHNELNLGKDKFQLLIREYLVRVQERAGKKKLQRNSTSKAFLFVRKLYMISSRNYLIPKASKFYLIPLKNSSRPISCILRIRIKVFIVKFSPVSIRQ